MEIPVASDFAQASALFTDIDQNETKRQVLGLWPVALPNKHLESLDLVNAASVSNLDKEFRTNDYQEAYRLLNGNLLYPFQDKAQIFHHKFDPFYWDGSELDGDYNVQENLIGTPLGASTLEDPRLTYVENILKMKELHGANNPLDGSYVQNLYMLNTEKGSNYYQNQLQKLEFGMAQHSRISRAMKYLPLHPIQFSKNLATGAPVHVKHTAKRKIEMPSEAGVQQTSRRQKRIESLDAAKLPHHVKPKVDPLRQINTPVRSMDPQFKSDIERYLASRHKAVRDTEAITIHTDQNGYREAVGDLLPEDELSYQMTPSTMPTLNMSTPMSEDHERSFLSQSDNSFVTPITADTAVMRALNDALSMDTRSTDASTYQTSKTVQKVRFEESGNLPVFNTPLGGGRRSSVSSELTMTPFSTPGTGFFDKNAAEIKRMEMREQYSNVEIQMSGEKVVKPPGGNRMSTATTVVNRLDDQFGTPQSSVDTVRQTNVQRQGGVVIIPKLNIPKKISEKDPRYAQIQVVLEKKENFREEVGTMRGYESLMTAMEKRKFPPERFGLSPDFLVRKVSPYQRSITNPIVKPYGPSTPLREKWEGTGREIS